MAQETASKKLEGESAEPAAKDPGPARPPPAPMPSTAGGPPPLPVPSRPGPPPIPVPAERSEPDAAAAPAPKPPEPIKPAEKGVDRGAVPPDAPVEAKPEARPPPPPPATDPTPREPKETTDGTRRSARRRPAGPSRPSVAANDDVSSIGGLIFALHQRPSGRPIRIALIASIVWAAVSVLLGWAMLAPELQRAPTVLEMLTRPTAITLAATIIIPIALFWLLALVAWRAQELKLMSSAMTEVAIRLAEPDRMAEQQIASVGQAVRRQVNFMNEAVGRALGRANELEAMVHNEVANLERSYGQNEQRIRGLLHELAGERHALLNTSERVNLSLKELGSEIPALIDKLGEQQIKLARFIEDAGRNLVSLESSLNASAGNLATSVGARAQELHTVLSGGTAALQEVITDRTASLQSLLTDQTASLETSLAEQTNALAQRADALHSVLTERTEALQQALSGQGGALEAMLGQRTDAMQLVFETFSDGLDQALGARTEGLQTVLEEYTRALDATLQGRQQALDATLHQQHQAFDAQMIERTKALDDAFSERLRLYDGSVQRSTDAFAERVALFDQAMQNSAETLTGRLKFFDEALHRSTIAMDSMVADKARALSTALEAHAREIGQVLGRQAGELDQQLMHGVNAVRMASQNVTKQSLKAIEDLAGQADLLKNVTENLVGQMSSVTNRFDHQGQTIMRAASALETTNSRIDRTLQNRQMELSRTLEHLSQKTESIDQALRGYSASLEGTINEAESRARTVGEQLTRGAEERARITSTEIERLQLQASSDTDRVLQDLRTRFANVSREVTEEIGSLSSRFAETSDDMRRQAQSTLADIESEQARLKAQLDRLPETTRASAETLRSSLQEQLKALEQLSSFSAREAVRGEIAPPTPAQQALPPQPRSISSVTQSLASEMASRAPQAALPPPSGASQPPPVPSHPPYVGAPQAIASSQLPPEPPRDGQTRDGWKLGELLARASQEEEAQRGAINIANMARALDATTASAIWARFRTGQRGIMVRSIYTVEGRTAFDEVQRRYKAEAGFRKTVDTYMHDFEQLLRDADQRDATGRTAQTYIVSESGRVYLFLAHASGRLA